MDASEANVVRNMALLRIASSFVELVAAVAILRLGRIGNALRINALLGLIGPLFLLAVTALGIHGLAGEVRPAKIALVVAGVLLVFIGTR
jgi:uncharacterized membrane protein